VVLGFEMRLYVSKGPTDDAGTQGDSRHDGR